MKLKQMTFTRGAVFYFLLICGIALLGVFLMGKGYGAPVDIRFNEGFTVAPEEKIFSVTNMYPGQTESANVTVSNDGSLPFALALALAVEGDQDLIDSLELTVNKSGGQEYSGKIEDMPSLDMGNISANQQVDLHFEIYFAPGKGNVTQNKKADLTWTFRQGDIETGLGETGADPIVTIADPGDTDVGATGITGGPAGPLGAPGPDSPGAAQGLETPPSPEEPAPVLLIEPEDVPLETEAEEVAAPVEEIAVDPEEPAAVPEEAEITAFNYWPLLLLLLLPLLWLLYATSLLVLVPGKDGDYEIVARKIARRKDKKWHVNVEKQLNKYVDKYGFVAVDFRGRFLKDANKAVYAGKTSIGSGNKRYALISNHRLTTWLEDLYKKGNRAVG